LVKLCDEFHQDVVRTIVEIASGRSLPPMTPDEVLTALDQAGLRNFASIVRPRL
jgi:hypothetical protein